MIKEFGSRQKIADECRVSYQTIKNIEEGARGIGTEIYLSLCKFFNLDPQTMDPLPGAKLVRRPKRIKQPQGVIFGRDENQSVKEYEVEIITDEEWSLIEGWRASQKNPNRELQHLRLKINATAPLTKGQREAITKTVDRDYLHAAQILLRLADDKG